MDKRLAQVLPWGTTYFVVVVMTISEQKQNITNFGFTHIIKKIDDLGFQLIPRFINPRDLIIILADGLGDNQISGVDY